MGKWGWLLLALLVVGLGSLAVHAGTMKRTYTWEYGGRSWSLTHEFRVERYQFFRTLPRAVPYTRYASYVNDERDDDDLASLVTALETMAYRANLNVWEKLNLIIAFVQSLPYAPEVGEYPRYPLETLVEQKGDCEDVAILAAALFKQMGFGVVLLAFTDEQHMALGVRVLPPEPGDYQAYAYNGDLYYYLELTAKGWTIGSIPSIYSSQPKIIAVQTR